MNTAVVDNPAEHRFELSEEGHVAIAAYKLEGDTIVFDHTVVPSELSGRGVGSRLIAGALEQVGARGLKVVPTCSFVRAYMDKHPELASLRAER